MTNKVKTHNFASQIPNGWKTTTLENLVGIRSGFAFKSEDFRSNFGFPVIKIKNIQPPIVNIENEDLVDICNYSKEKLSKFEVKNGEYLIAMTGETIGKVGKYNLGYFAYINQRVCKIVKTEKSDYSFVYYSLLQSGFQKFIDTHSFGAAQANISTDQIGKFLILAPPLLEQKAIASVLSSLDDKIELLREQNKTLETTAQTIFKEWFVKFNFPGTTGKMIDSELGKIPVGWRIYKFKELVNQLKPGTNYQPKRLEYGIPFINGRNVQNGFLDLTDVTYISEEEYKRVHQTWVPEENDILITRIGTLGNVGVIQKENLPLAVHYNSIVIKEGILKHQFIYFLLKSELFQNYYHLNKKQAVQEFVTIESVENIQLVFPSKLEILFNVSENFNLFFEKILCNTSQIQTLSTLRDTLLLKLMKGELRVKGFEK